MHVFQLYENANCKCKFGHSIISHKTTKGSTFEKKKKDFTCYLNAYFQLCCMHGYSKFTLCCNEIVHVLSLNRDQLCFCRLYRPENRHLSDFLTRTSVSYTGSLRRIVLKVPFMGQMSQSLESYYIPAFFTLIPLTRTWYQLGQEMYWNTDRLKDKRISQDFCLGWKMNESLKNTGLQ